MFLLFTVVMGTVLYLHFFFAHRCWRRVRGEVPEDIDPGYVRREDYFGQSFRTKLQSWLELPAVAQSDGTRTIQHQHERIHISPSRNFPDRAESDEVHVIEGDFTCGASSHFNREIYAQGNVTIGQGSECQAIAADRDITLGPGVQVARWVDSHGDLRMAHGAIVYSRTSARISAKLERGAEAHSVFAPLIITWSAIRSAEPPTTPDAASPPTRLSIPPPPNTPPESWKNTGVDPAKFVPLGADCWIYRGSFLPATAIHLTAPLVVRGDCDIPGGSLLEHDLKAARNLSVGASAECRGNLIAEKSLSLARSVRFGGLVHAHDEILLRAGTHGESPAGPVAVDAGSWLYVEEGVTVHGKLSSGERVRVVDASFAAAWAEKHKTKDRT
jgi:hypothetical protein